MKRNLVDKLLDGVEWFLDIGWTYVGGAALVVICLALTTMLLMICGYVLGLWHVPCPLDSSQPHCIAAGWGKHLDVVVKH